MQSASIVAKALSSVLPLGYKGLESKSVYADCLDTF